MSAIIGTEHSWKRMESVQWGSRGLGYDAAATPYVCETCGATFNHRYHAQPDIYQAMQDSGVPAECVKPVGDK